MEKSSVHFISRSNEWETPQGLFDLLNNEFHFTLDPCATKENAKCSRYFTIKENGLIKSWANETVFMNPPYGRIIGDWVKKAYCETLATVVCLIPARTDTSYFHEYCMKADEIRFIRGRLYFNDGAGRAPFPSCVVIFRRPRRRFAFVRVTQLQERAAELRLERTTRLGNLVPLNRI